MIEWLLNNKEWFFSGIGVFAIGIIISLFKRKEKKSINQSQTSGNNSHNFQSAGNLNVTLPNQNTGDKKDV
ncbi:hypothetical protein DFP93_103164 [Aneurinibacillus soli]|uniref:Uncharacterized protein n=1 Tax=Aneurinibacillus soli TaxID=1500254 RepID=A0A0U5BDD9_9BACL|nr:hypothetical protein [Aneurinibacillus soli]PYE62953.1 hypothetical protein DFP93_103164 [Aneurinibacillus soli]BAU28988.1 hypothetical protein CB4_03166 [Aneurinibacillus soli]